MTRAPRSLQRRLVLLVLGLVIAVWASIAVLTWVETRHELDELLDGHLAQAAALLVVQHSEDLEDAGRRQDAARDAPEERRVDKAGRKGDDAADEPRAIRAPLLDRLAPRVAFQVFHENRLVLRSATAPASPMVPLERHFREGFASVRLPDGDWRVFAAYGAERDVQVYVGEREASRGAILRALLKGTLAPMLLALPLLALAVWWSVYRGMAPLRALGRLLALRQPQALDPVQLRSPPAEMLPMVDALNALFERIGALLESERRFTADAAHELRTPIAAVRTQAQVALAESDDARRRHALQATLDGCDRATRLVEQLLTLSRLEAAGAPALQPLDLAALARQAVAELAPRAIARRQQLGLDAPASPMPVRGNDTLLAVLLRNLIDNAIRYSPFGAQVAVALHGGADGTTLRVEDSGPGLDAAQQARLGERFWRASHSESGSGLGWSIVRRIADVHGIAIEVGRSTALGGLAVTLRFPR